MAKYSQSVDPLTSIKKGVSFDKKRYEDLLAKKPDFGLDREFEIHVSSAEGFTVRAGQTFRVVQAYGPQICDMIMFNRHNHEERSDFGNCMALEGMALRKFTRVWSTIPWMRPMATMIEDTPDYGKIPEGYIYHMWGPHCCTEWYELAYGSKGHQSCHMHFTQALAKFGMGEAEARLTNMNLFQPETVSLDPDGRLRAKMHPTVTEVGDYVEFYAEMDLLVVISNCPYGDQSTSVENAVCRNLGVEIYDTGVAPLKAREWHDWRPEAMRFR